jgi:glucosamine kinase
MSTEYLIGVDGGGTKTKLLLEDTNGKVLATTVTGPSNITRSIDTALSSIQKGIQLLSQKSNLKINNSQIRLGLGLAGAENEQIKMQFLARAPQYIPGVAQIILKSDAHVACLGIHAGKAGAIIIVGTGTQGYQIEDNNKTTRIACWGSPVDDQGGGSWLGLEAIRMTFKCIDGRQKPNLFSKSIFKKFGNNLDAFVIWANQASTCDYATLTKDIVTAAELGDTTAIDLLKRASKEINLIIDTLKRKQTSDEKLPLCIIGGMAPFIKPYLDPKMVESLVPRLHEHDICEGAIFMLKDTFS